MIERSRLSLLLLAASAALAGCGKTAPPAATGTGAREEAQQFFEGIIQRDWSRAYTTLLPEIRFRLPQDRFARLGEQSLQRIGFTVNSIHFKACEEKGEQAIAHVFLLGRDQQKPRRYQESLVLRRTAEGWKVMLPSSFNKSG